MNPFVRDFFRIIFANLLVKPAWILTENGVQNVIGHESYGRYAALFSLTFILATMLDPGLTQYATREIAADNPGRQKIFGTILGIKLLLALVFPGVVWVGMVLWGYENWSMGLTLAGLQICLALLAFFRGAMQGLHLFTADAFFSIADKALLFPLLFLFWSGMTAERFAVMNLSVAIGCVAAASALLSRRIRFSLPHRRLIFDVLWQSRHFALMVLLYNMLDRLNLVLVERRLGSDVAGLFAGAHRWFGAFTMYLWTVLPILYAKFAKTQDHNLIGKGLPFVAIPLIWVGGFCIFHGEKLLFLFTKSTSEEVTIMTKTLSILGATLILAGIHNIFSTFLTATGKEKSVNILIIAAITVNVCVFMLMPRTLGACVGAWGLLAAHMVLFVGYPCLVKFKSRLPPPYSVLGRLTTFAILYLAVLKFTDDCVWWISTAWACMLSGVWAALVFRKELKKQSRP